MTYDKMRQDYERMREAEKNRIVDEWKAANGYDDLLAAYAKSARDLEEARAFLRQTAMAGGSIVSSASMTPRQIAIARAADRMLVMPDGYGFVYVPGPRFCACGRPESDCDQSRAGCPKENDES